MDICTIGKVFPSVFTLFNKFKFSLIAKIITYEMFLRIQNRIKYYRILRDDIVVGVGADESALTRLCYFLFNKQPPLYSDYFSLDGCQSSLDEVVVRIRNVYGYSRRINHGDKPIMNKKSNCLGRYSSYNSSSVYSKRNNNSSVYKPIV